MVEIQQLRAASVVFFFNSLVVKVPIQLAAALTAVVHLLSSHLSHLFLQIRQLSNNKSPQPTELNNNAQ